MPALHVAEIVNNRLPNILGVKHWTLPRILSALVPCYLAVFMDLAIGIVS